MPEEEVDHSVLGIIDESEPDVDDEADADYSREDDPEEKPDSPSDKSDDADTPDAKDEPEGEDSAEESDEEPKSEKDKDTPADDEDGEGEGPVEFAGREYENLEAIEQAFKSFEGRVNAETAKAQDYEQRLSDYYEYVQKVGKENDELREGTKLPAPVQDGTPKAEDSKNEMDLEQVLRVAQLGVDRGIEPMEAVIKVYDSAQKKLLDSRLEDLEAKVTAPVEAMEAEAETAQAERELFTYAQNQKDEDGESKYPMLQKDSLDDGFTANVYEAWQALAQKFGAAYAYSEIGFEKAYSLAHDYAIDSGDFELLGDDEGEGEPSESSEQFREDLNADAEAASDLTGETPKINRTKKTPGAAALEELGAHAEVSLEGGDPLGFYE